MREKEQSSVNSTLPARQSRPKYVIRCLQRAGAPVAKQLADHWLKLNYPEEIKPKDVILEKSRGSEGKVA